MARSIRIGLGRVDVVAFHKASQSSGDAYAIFTAAGTDVNRKERTGVARA